MFLLFVCLQDSWLPLNSTSFIAHFTANWPVTYLIFKLPHDSGPQLWYCHDAIRDRLVRKGYQQHCPSWFLLILYFIYSPLYPKLRVTYILLLNPHFNSPQLWYCHDAIRDRLVKKGYQQHCSSWFLLILYFIYFPLYPKLRVTYILLLNPHFNSPQLWYCHDAIRDRPVGKGYQRHYSLWFLSYCTSSTRHLGDSAYIHTL